MVFGGSCALCYWGCDDVDNCTEVQDCEVLLFPCVPLVGNAHMMPRLIAWFYTGLIMSMVWH
jgi:hypothetical protein